MQICNLRPVSYEALCGNLENLKCLISANCNLNVDSSSDCNILIWALICSNKQSRINVINYLCENRIFDHFEDQTETIIKDNSFESIDYDNPEVFTSDGLSAFYYLMLSPNFAPELIHDALKYKSIHEIIQPKLIEDPSIHSDKIRRVARYYYIAGCFLHRYGLNDLAINSYQSAIDHWCVIQKLDTCDSRELGYLYNALGKVYYHIAEWQKATECYSAAVGIYNNIEEKTLIDHQELTKYRTNLAGYLNDNEIDINYFNRYQDL